MRPGDNEPVRRFGVLLRAYRREAGLTQRELAAKAGLSLAALRDIEQCRRSRPRPSSLDALANGLGLDQEQAASLISAGRGLTVPQPLRRTAPAGPTGPGQGLWLAALGPLEAWRDGLPIPLGPPARRAVLGLLLMDPGAQVHRDTIIDVVWGQSPPSTAVGLVQAHVSRLRRVLEPPLERHSGGDGIAVIDSIRSTYRLRLSVGELDLFAFRELSARAAVASADGDFPAACERYEQAVGLLRGDPLADLGPLRDHPGISLLRQQLTGVLLRYAEVAFALGQYRRVLPRLQALAAADPMNEPAHARLMIALAGSGQQAAAIRVYEDLRSGLDRELGLYPGEELTEAHLRVLRQDFRAGDSRRQPAVAARLNVVPRQLPAASRYFTGRVGELAELSQLLEQEPGETIGVVVAALTGMAGIGKTALAVYWAHQVADRFPDGQLFVDLRGFSPVGAPAPRTAAVSGFLTALGVPVGRIPEDAAGQAALYRSTLVGRRMLIVLDNARGAEQVRSLLPGSPGCLVLVTSRNRLAGLAAAEGASLLPLDVMTYRQSQTLLTRNLSAGRAAAEPAAVNELIVQCAGLPLALCDVAARAAARPALPLAAVAAEMRDARRRLDVFETGESATSVRQIFSLSRARLSSLAGRMFRLLGVHAGPDITVRAAASLAALPPGRAHLALAELCDEHVLTEHAPGRYACHDLLRAYAAETASTRLNAAGRRRAVYRVLDYYLHASNTAAALLYPSYTPLQLEQARSTVLLEEFGGDADAAQWFENERHVLLAAIAQAADDGYTPHAWQLPWIVGSFLGDSYWQEFNVARDPCSPTRPAVAYPGSAERILEAGAGEVIPAPESSRKIPIRPPWRSGTRQTGPMSGIAWLKITDPAIELPLVSPDTDPRVLLPDIDEFAVRAKEFAAAGAQLRQVRYLVEDEIIIASRERQEAINRTCGLNRPYRGTYTKVTGAAVAAARDAFCLMWQRSEPVSVTPEVVDALVPAELAPFLPHRTLNQAQAEVVPEILGHDQNLLVVAPTGAGKTVMRMVAALRAMLQQGRKAAWLVPQRSLTDELDRELATWREQGCEWSGSPASTPPT